MKDMVGGVTFNPLTGDGTTSGLTGADIFSAYQIGTRTIWSPVANLDIGVEVLYSKINQSHVGSWTLATAGSRPGGSYRADDTDMWTGTVRVTRNFWP